MEVSEIYAESRSRVLGLAESAPSLDVPVPATPAWSAHDLFAHMVGVAADVAAGRVEGAGGDEWTAKQVAERKGTPVAELADEWRSTAEKFDPMLSAAPVGLASALAADVVQHELDLRGALGAPADESVSGAVDFGLNFMAGYLDSRVRKAGLGVLVVRAGNQEWTLGEGEGEPAAVLTTTPLEFFRVLAGRRSAAQVTALDWSGDPAPYLGVLSAFGPLSPTDVIE